MGLPFFEKVVFFQQKYGNGHIVGNGLQTNGLLLNEKWAEFLKKYHFLVGLSIDGPEHVHDHYRVSKNQTGTWHRVVEKAEFMLSEGVEVNALSVVNDYSVKFPEEIYEFLKKPGFRFIQFIPCVETDPEDPSGAASFSVNPEKYGEFLIKLFELWKTDFVEGMPTTFVRFFDSVFYTYVGMQSPECTILKTCGEYVVVEHNGDVYSCDFFVKPEWKLGNIMTGRLTGLLNSPQQKSFGNIKSDLPPKCKECQWLKYCWGGCIKDRIRDRRDNNMNHFCESYRMFFKHADGFFRNLAENWKREQNSADMSRKGNY